MNCLIRVIPAAGGSRAKELGMTLVEVVFALLISSLTLAALVGGYISSTMAAEKASLSLAANTRAIERLEETHAATWNVSTWPAVDELVAANFPTKVVTIDLSGQGAGITYGKLSTTITQISLSPLLRRVRVDCVWQFQGRPFTNTVETLRGPN